MSLQKADRIEEFSQLFFNDFSNILDYLEKPSVLIYEGYQNDLKHYLFEVESQYQDTIARKELALEPEKKFFTISEIDDLLSQHSRHDGLLVDFVPNIHYQSLQNKVHVTDILAEFINLRKKTKVFICCPTNSAADKVKSLLDLRKIAYTQIENFANANNMLVNICVIPLSKGFYDNKNTFISYQDIFGIKGEIAEHKGSKTSAKKFRNILVELSNIKTDELVVHEDYGIGKFLGIHPLTIKNQIHDCVKIEYACSEYLYTPVENMDAIKRYGSEYAELDKLGGLSFNRRKAVLQDKINEIAYKLIEVAANRTIKESTGLILNLDTYQKFCDAFPYIETEDQQKAIDDIRDDFDSGKLIDRLVCGDVGFGKTEVAMRAAFMAVNNVPKMQVAVIAPTTILARQHYNNFKERFNGFNVKIAEISRLVSQKQQKLLRDQLSKHEIDVVIGTHSLLSDNVKFENLGLLIIDEEQHFGVAHKEKLKSLRDNLHVIALSATPIPRSLQMSLSGIKSLSIIATPPTNRLAIKTVVTTYSDSIVKDALIREHSRGGKSFYVVPRIEHIEKAVESVRRLVPNLKITAAHGRMSPSLIDQVMTDFYGGEYDVLISTSIIESGLDIKSANTIIINNAEMFGLSQLYQLRGRVGRSNVKGYAYLLISENKKLTREAYRRLEIMETIDAIGAGFVIASHDMDLRGFGNLVGEQQSGHIKEIGVELYQQMLEEAIAKANNQKVEKHFSPSINIGLPVYIPESYIQDSNLRLSLYRRISELKSDGEVQIFKEELIDRFGSVPVELSNLFLIVNIKAFCKDLGIKSIDCGDGGFVFKFIENNDTVSSAVMEYFSKHPDTTKLKPDNKVVFIRDFKKIKAKISLQNKVKNNSQDAVDESAIIVDELKKILLELSNKL